MQNFNPYIAEEDSTTRLHLREAGWRKNLYFFVFRILPFFFHLEAIIIFTVARKDAQITTPVLGLFILLVTCIPAAILFTRKYILELELTPMAVSFTRSSFRGRINEVVLVADINHIKERKRNGKGGGYFYYLVLKNGKKERLIKFPLFGMSDEKRRFINARFKQITALELVHG